MNCGIWVGVGEVIASQTAGIFSVIIDRLLGSRVFCRFLALNATYGMGFDLGHNILLQSWRISGNMVAAETSTFLVGAALR